MQWDRVSARVNSLPYLLKQLKLVGWSTSMLISAYRAHGLSHFVYSAPVLTSCTDRAKGEMASFQRKALQAIGINESNTHDLFNIAPIDVRVDDICARMLDRMLADKEHTIYENITKNERTGFYYPRQAKQERYNQSFLVKFMRLERETRQKTRRRFPL